MIVSDQRHDVTKWVPRLSEAGQDTNSILE